MRQDALLRRAPGFIVARELCLAAFIAVVTWAAWLGPFNIGWSGCNCQLGSPVTGATVAAGVLLAWLRFWSPSVALVGAAALLAWYPGSAIVLAVTAFHASARIPGGRRVTTVFALAAATAVGITLARAPFPWPVVLFGEVPAVAVALALPAAVQVLLGKANRLLAALRERAHYLEENYRLAHSAARLQERSRIAHEMHDQLGHRLTLILLHAGALEIITGGGAARGASEAQMISNTVRAAMQELRTTLGVLGGSAPDEPRARSSQEAGTRSDVSTLIAESRSAGMQVQLQWRGDDLDDVHAAVRAAVHRLVREALTNVHRHAAGAPASVVVDHGQDRVRVDVWNPRPPAPGPTSAITGTGLGLVGVQERVQLLGGHFSAGPTAEGGFRVLAELPLAGPVAPAAVHGPPLSQLNGTPAAGFRPISRREVRRAERDRLIGRATGAVLGAGLVGVQALVLVVFSVVPYGLPGESLDSDPLAIEVGAPREVVEEVVQDDSLVRLAGQALESPPPEGAECRYALDFTDEDDDGVIVRFCILGDSVVAVDRYDLPEAES